MTGMPEQITPTPDQVEIEGAVENNKKETGEKNKEEVMEDATSQASKTDITDKGEDEDKASKNDIANKDEDEDKAEKYTTKEEENDKIKKKTKSRETMMRRLKKETKMTKQKRRGRRYLKHILAISVKL